MTLFVEDDVFFQPTNMFSAALKDSRKNVTTVTYRAGVFGDNSDYVVSRLMDAIVSLRSSYLRLFCDGMRIIIIVTNFQTVEAKDKGKAGKNRGVEGKDVFHLDVFDHGGFWKSGAFSPVKRSERVSSRKISVNRAGRQLSDVCSNDSARDMSEIIDNMLVMKQHINTMRRWLHSRRASASWLPDQPKKPDKKKNLRATDEIVKYFLWDDGISLDCRHENGTDSGKIRIVSRSSVQSANVFLSLMVLNEMKDILSSVYPDDLNCPVALSNFQEVPDIRFWVGHEEENTTIIWI